MAGSGFAFHLTQRSQNHQEKREGSRAAVPSPAQAWGVACARVCPARGGSRRCPTAGTRGHSPRTRTRGSAAPAASPERGSSISGSALRAAFPLRGRGAPGALQRAHSRAQGPFASCTHFPSLSVIFCGFLVSDVSEGFLFSPGW